MKVEIDTKEGKPDVVDLGIAERPTTEAPTAEQAVEGDAPLSERELADATKHNLLKKKPEPPATPAAAVPAKPPVPAVPEKKADEPAPPVVTEKAKIAIEELLQDNPDPVREAEAIKDWSPNEKALYHGRKKAVRRAQRAEKALGEKDTEIADLRAQLAAKPGDEDPMAGLDDEGKPKVVVPEKKPTGPTPEQLAERQAAVRKTLDEQERDFKTVHEDFNPTFDLTQDIIARAEESDEKLAELFPNPLERRGVRMLLNEFAASVAFPDHPKLQRLAPEIAYEIGSLHPKRQKPDSGGKPADEPPARPAKVAKVDEPPPSSGSISSGAQATAKKITDMTADEYVTLSPDKVLELRTRYPKEFAALERRIG